MGAGLCVWIHAVCFGHTDERMFAVRTPLAIFSIWVETVCCLCFQTEFEMKTDISSQQGWSACLSHKIFNVYIIPQFLTLITLGHYWATVQGKLSLAFSPFAACVSCVSVSTHYTCAGIFESGHKEGLSVHVKGPEECVHTQSVYVCLFIWTVLFGLGCVGCDFVLNLSLILFISDHHHPTSKMTQTSNWHARISHPNRHTKGQNTITFPEPSFSSTHKTYIWPSLYWK